MRGVEIIIFKRSCYEIGFFSVDCTLATRTTWSISERVYLYSQAQNAIHSFMFMPAVMMNCSNFPHSHCFKLECVKFKFYSILYKRNFNTHIFWHAIWCRLLKSQCNLSCARSLSIVHLLHFKCHKKFYSLDSNEARLSALCRASSATEKKIYSYRSIFMFIWN